MAAVDFARIGDVARRDELTPLRGEVLSVPAARSLLASSAQPYQLQSANAPLTADQLIAHSSERRGASVR